MTPTERDLVLRVTDLEANLEEVAKAVDRLFGVVENQTATQKLLISGVEKLYARMGFKK